MDGGRDNAFGEQVRWARKRKGWSQQTLAKRAGIDRATLSLIENGRENPRMDTVRSLAEALGVSPSKLWSGAAVAGSEALGVGDPMKPALREAPGLTYEPVSEAHLHPGLEELLEDERTRLMLAITPEEEAMLRSIRTRRDAPLGRDFFIDVLISYRRHHG